MVVLSFEFKERKMKLEGLKANFLGDSITEGHGVENLEDTYWNVLKRECGLAEARGYGIGGTRIARQTLPSENPRHDLDFLSRVEEMDADADLVVFFGGTNDFGHGEAPIGQMSDRSPYSRFICKKRDSAPGGNIKRKILSGWTASQCSRSSIDLPET